MVKKKKKSNSTEGCKVRNRSLSPLTPGPISQRLPLLTVRNFLFVVFTLQVICPSFEGEDEI